MPPIVCAQYIGTVGKHVLLSDVQIMNKAITKKEMGKAHVSVKSSTI